MAAGAGAGAGAGELRSQLEEAKLGLQRLERDIRKVAIQHAANRNPERNFQNSPVRGGGLRSGKPNYGPDGGFPQRGFYDDRQNKKRPQETKTVFSRLSARPAGDSDNEDEGTPVKKPRISSQVIRDLPTKQEVLKAQEGDEQSKARNRRIFGSLLGTLQKFKQESIVLQNKEDKKAQVERKIEEQAKLEKENQKKERQNLFAEREIKRATIKALEAKVVRMREFEKWELAHNMMIGFIRTKGKPNIFWKPKKMSEPAEEKWNNSKKSIEKMMEKKRQDVTSELNAIEQRCLRNVRLPPGSHVQTSHDSENIDDDKFDREGSSENERIQRPSVVVKQERDGSERKIKRESQDVSKKDKSDRNFENGNAPTAEKWNRDESDSSSDENDHSPQRAVEKDHSMDESSRTNENGEEDPGGVDAKDKEMNESTAATFEEESFTENN